MPYNLAQCSVDQWAIDLSRTSAVGIVKEEKEEKKKENWSFLKNGIIMVNGI